MTSSDDQRALDGQHHARAAVLECRSALDGCPALAARGFTGYLVDLLGAGEPGIALEDLCSNLIEFDLPVPPAARDHMAAAAAAMEMPARLLDSIGALPTSGPRFTHLARSITACDLVALISPSPPPHDTDLLADLGWISSDTTDDLGPIT